MSFTEYKHYFIVEYKYLLNVKYFWLNVNIKIRFCYKDLVLFYNTSTRHERHEWDTSNTRATRVWHEGKKWVRYERQEFDTSATRTVRVRPEWKILITTCEHFFSPPYIYYMVSEWLPGEEQFHSKNYLLEMPSSNALAFEKYTTKT